MKKFLSLIAILSLIFSPVTPAFAATRTWSGLGADDDWGTAGNWSALPVANDNLTFAGTTRLTPNNNFAAATTFGNLVFNNTSGAFTLSGNGITLGGNVTNNDTDIQTINLDLALNATRNFNAASGDIVVGGVVSDGGGGFGLNKTGANALTLNAANTYSGGTTLSNGMLNINNASALGAGAFTITGGTTIDNTSGGLITVANNAQNWNGNFTFTGTNDLDLGSGAVTLSNNRTVTVNAGNLTVGGVINDGGSGYNLTKTGAGTLTLSGANTYTGTTKITAGTLALGAAGVIDDTSAVTVTGTLELNGNSETIGSLAGTGTVTDGGAAATLTTGGNNNTTTFSGTIGGATALTKDGTGTMTLSGANSYTGLTTVSNGELKIQNASALGTVDAGTVVNTGNSLRIQGDITTAAEALTLNGNGSGNNGALQNISGDNNYTGLITLGSNSRIQSNAGTLTLSNAGTITGAFNLNVRGASDTVINSIIGTGAGTFTKAGNGTVTLKGASTYTGLTTVSAGVLNIQNNTATGTTAGGVSVTSGAALQTQGGIAVGTEALTLNGTGVAADGALRNISGNNSWAGAIALASATRINSDADTLTISGTIDAANNLTVGGAGNTTLTGVIGALGNAGTLTKDGTGTLTLSNANTYTGLTTITAGTLAYNNSVSSASAHTNNSTLLLGTNTLTITGANAYTQNAGSTLDLTIDNTATFGNIVATGANAVINTGSTVNVTVSQYLAGGTSFLIVDGNAAGAPGIPGTITSSSAMYTFTGTVAAGDLTITAARANTFNGVASGTTGAGAGGALDSIATSGTATGDMLNVINELSGMGSTQEINGAIETMTPDVSSGTAEGSRALTGQGFTMISNRLGGARSGFVGSGVSAGEMLDGVGVWMQALGSHMKQDARKGIEGFKANLFDTMVGVDKVLNNHWRAGLAGGYGWAGVKSKTPGSPSDNINSFQGTIYGSYDSLDLYKARQGGKKSYEAVRSQVENSWYVDGMFGFTQNNYDSRREIWLGNTKRVAKADHYGQQYSTNFEAGYKFVFEETKNLEITPFMSLGYNYLYMNKYKEDGANALNLTVQGEGFHQLEQGLGTKLAYPMVAKKVGTFIPSVKAAWLYDYIGDQFETSAQFAGGGPSFGTKGAKPAKNGMLFGAELAFLDKGNMTVTGNWDIEVKNQFMSNTYYGTVRYDF